MSVNGEKARIGSVVRSPGDLVCVDGVPVRPGAEREYFILHKPRGYLSTRSDDRGRPTVLDLLPDASDKYLYPVGRLDLDSSGLILLTNDGALANLLLHPSHRIEKVYRVLLNRRLSDGEMRAFREGRIVLDGRTCAPAGIRPLLGARRSGWYEVRLREGRKRQIRRMAACLGADVELLVRIAMGPLCLRGLAEGRYRRLSDEEVKALSELAGGSGP